MVDEYKILAVDDESINREILLTSLEGHYLIRCVGDGQACLSLLDSWQPDIILMDVEMPGLNGLDTCKLIKTNSNLAELPVIFISDVASPDERLAGYQAGGIDYITKPFVPNELIAKINISLFHKQQIEIAREKTQIVKLTARTAVEAAVEGSHVTRFLQYCLSSNSLSEVVDHFFQTISEYNLHAVADFRTHTKQFTQSNTDSVNTLEVGLLRKMSKKTGVCSFGKRAVYNRKYISLLILDLPSDDNYKYDRLLDNVEMIVDAASYAIQKLIKEEIFQEKLIQLNSLALSTAESLQQLQTMPTENTSDNSDLVKSLLTQITDTLAKFGDNAIIDP